MDIINFLNQNYFFLVPVLWVIGYAIKQTPFIPDWAIIWIILGISLGIGTFAFGLSVDAITNAVIAAGVAVFGHQMFKQTIGVKMNSKQDTTTKGKDKNG